MHSKKHFFGGGESKIVAGFQSPYETDLFSGRCTRSGLVFRFCQSTVRSSFWVKWRFRIETIEIDGYTTVDGKNPANQLRLIVFLMLYHYLIHPRWFFGISSINRSTTVYGGFRQYCHVELHRVGDVEVKIMIVP